MVKIVSSAGELVVHSGENGGDSGSCCATGCSGCIVPAAETGFGGCLRRDGDMLCLQPD
jgi:hypothetical protein